MRNVAGGIFPSRKSRAASPLASHGGSATKKVPHDQESHQLRSYVGYGVVRYHVKAGYHFYPTRGGYLIYLGFPTDM